MKTRSLLFVSLMAAAGQGLHAEEERLVDKAGRTIKKGGEAAEQGIEKGASAAGKGAGPAAAGISLAGATSLPATGLVCADRSGVAAPVWL